MSTISGVYEHKDTAETVQAFNDLIEDSLRTVLAVNMIVMWLWAVFIAFYFRPRFVYTLLALVLIGTVSWLSYRLSTKHLNLAVAVYLAGLVVGVTMIVVFFDDPAMLYLYLLVLLVTVMLTKPGVTWGVAFISIFLVWWAGTDYYEARPAEVMLPIAFILLTALTASLNSRKLFTALDWTFRMTEQAQRNAKDAQAHRAELQRVMKSLDEAYVRLRNANEALAYAQEAAEKAYRFKAEFVANVSHELRTPLNLIVGFSKMMATAPESYRGVSLPREYRGDMMALYRSARHLSALVDDVLDLSQIEADSMPLIKEATDLGQVVAEAGEMMQRLVESKGLSLLIDTPDTLPLLNLDRTRIRQVLLNLLANAARFTEAGFIRVRLRNRGQEVAVTIEDSGAGIPPQKVATAFEAFSQAETHQSVTGSGLGLAVSKRFVELHGGRIWLESEVGRGTTVQFTLPLPQEEIAGAPSPLLDARSSPRPAKGEPAIVVFHDDRRIVNLLHRYIEGFRFMVADTLETAQALIQNSFPIAVILDTHWAAARSLHPQALKLPAYTPLISCPLPSMLRLGSILGAANYLVKPFEQDDLHHALAALPRMPQTVLVIDDNPDIIRLVSRMLGAIDPSIRVVEALGGQEGLAGARAVKPDLILLDLVMPDMDGYRVIEEIAHDETLAETRLIIISAQRLEQEAEPLPGEITLARKKDFSLTEVLHMLQAALATTTRSAAIRPGDAAT